ncbi:hypothetical protein MW887_010805 [Aspergillus wentii]|nr:hypothetical protein MW887_010805 [Aspergillus wentii]
MVRGEAQTGLEYNGGDFNNQIHNTSTTTSWDLPPDIHAIPSNQYVLYPANPLNNVGFVDNSWSVYDGFESPWTQELWPSPSAPFPTMEPGYPGSPWFPSLQSSSSSFRSPANGTPDNHNEHRQSLFQLFARRDSRVGIVRRHIKRAMVETDMKSAITVAVPNAQVGRESHKGHETALE